jgi:hypothetical protein
MATTVTKRCPVCTRFRSYDPDDTYCVECGHEGLEGACTCGRAYDYEIPKEGMQAHCPRCGRPFRGKLPEYDG